MLERKIQTYITNESGQKIVTYRGQGLGERKLVVQKNGRTVSETYNVWDTLFHDEMTPYDTTKWSSTITPVQADDGITVAETSGTSTSFSASYTAIEDVIIEFDAIGVSVANNGVRFYYKGADHYINSYLTDNDWHHFKFVCENGEVIPYVDGDAKSSKSTISNTNCRFILNNSSIKFKNFKVYSV